MPVTDAVATPSVPSSLHPAAALESPATADVTRIPLDDLPDGVIVADGSGWVRELNSPAVRMLRIDGAAAIGRHLSEVAPLLDEQGNDWWECGRVVRSMPSVSRQPERRLTLVGDDERDLLVTVRFQRSGGSLAGVVLCLREAVSRERIERGHSDLIATVAHELRSPLTSVKGFTATLLARWDRFPDDTKKAMLQTVNADADRVTRLLTELLDVSRIDTGRVQLHRQVVDVERIARKVVDGRVATGEGPERFELAVLGEPPEMWLDPDKIEQILHNLVENALQHGGGKVRVVVRPETSAPLPAGTPGVTVLVEDEGSGVPDGSAGRVFAKYWRGAGRGGGTGLGLYIANGLVEAHGGAIAAERSAAGGASFRFTLPAGAPAFAT